MLFDLGLDDEIWLLSPNSAANPTYRFRPSQQSGKILAPGQGWPSAPCHWLIGSRKASGWFYIHLHIHSSPDTRNSWHSCIRVFMSCNPLLQYLKSFWPPEAKLLRLHSDLPKRWLTIWSRGTPLIPKPFKFLYFNIVSI